MCQLEFGTEIQIDLLFYFIAVLAVSNLKILFQCHIRLFLRW